MDILALALLVGAIVKARLDPVIIQIPDARPVFPGAGAQAVIARQGIRQHAQVGSTLDIVVAAENIGAPARYAHVAQCQLEYTVGAGVVVTNRMLGTAHAPDEGARPVVSHRLGRSEHLVARYTGDPLGLLRRPLGHFLADILHAVDPLTDELLVFPAVLEDVIEHAPDDADVGTGANLQVMVGVRGGARVARIDDDHRRIVFLLGLEDVLQRDRMGLGRVGADQQNRLGIVDIVVGVGHGAIPPGIGDAGDRGRVTYPRLVIDIVGAPHGGKLAEQVGLLVVELRRTQPEHRIGARGFTNLQQLVADVVDGLVPGHLLPLTIDQFGRVFEPALTVPMLANGCALGAMRALVERVIKGRLLAGPDTVLHLSDDAAAHRTMGTDGLDLLDMRSGVGCGMGLLHHVWRKGRGQRRATGHQAGALEEIASVDHRGVGGRGLALDGIADRGGFSAQFFHGSASAYVSDL